jgi:uncharacterized membrane protein
MPTRYLLLLIFVGVLLTVFIQLEIISIAFQKLGLSPHSALLLMLWALLGSSINIPLGTVSGNPAAAPPPDIPVWNRIRYPVRPPATGRMIIAVNLGGCIIPLGIVLHLLVQQLVAPLDLLLALPVISAVCYLFSRPVPGVGIAGAAGNGIDRPCTRAGKRSATCLCQRGAGRSGRCGPVTPE